RPGGRTGPAGSGCDPARPEQPVPLDRAYPGRPRDSRRDRRATGPLRRGEPARRRGSGHGAARSYAHPHPRRDDSGPRFAFLRGSDRRARRRRIRRARDGGGRADRDADAHARRRCGAPSRAGGAGGGLRVAIVGGTGPFGKALAARLHESGVDVVVGSRDAERAAATARELGCAGAENGEACRDADFVVLAVKADAALPTARDLRESITTKPVLSVASELTFSEGGALPSSDPLSLAQPIQPEL